jgi:aldehyde dehydrogenase (NAD+)
MEIAREEIFGPVLCVIPFKDEADAIRIANASDFGLGAGIWSRDIGRVHRVAGQLEAGRIVVNEYSGGFVQTPCGGYKHSGYGREQGIDALSHYTQLKSVIIRL